MSIDSLFLFSRHSRISHTNFRPRVQLLSQQPQYTNVEEALRLHQQYMAEKRRLNQLPQIDEAGYASLIVARAKETEIHSEPKYQEIQPKPMPRNHEATYMNTITHEQCPDLLKPNDDHQGTENNLSYQTNIN